MVFTLCEQEIIHLHMMKNELCVGHYTKSLHAAFSKLREGKPVRHTGFTRSLSSHDTFHTIWSISWRPIEPSATLRLIGINLTARFCWKITVVVSDVTVPELNTWITMNKSLYNWTFWWLNLMYSVLLGPSWHRVPADASGCCRGPAVCRAECVLGIRKAAEH